MSESPDVLYSSGKPVRGATSQPVPPVRPVSSQLKKRLGNSKLPRYLQAPTPPPLRASLWHQSHLTGHGVPDPGGCGPRISTSWQKPDLDHQDKAGSADKLAFWCKPWQRRPLVYSWIYKIGP